MRLIEASYRFNLKKLHFNSSAMANEAINRFIDRIAHMYRDETDAFHQFTLLEVLIHYEETVLSMAKFKCQKQYLKETIKDLNPGYYEGYYHKRRKEKI